MAHRAISLVAPLLFLAAASTAADVSPRRAAKRIDAKPRPCVKYVYDLRGNAERVEVGR